MVRKGLVFESERAWDGPSYIGKSGHHLNCARRVEPKGLVLVHSAGEMRSHKTSLESFEGELVRHEVRRALCNCGLYSNKALEYFTLCLRQHTPVVREVHERGRRDQLRLLLPQLEVYIEGPNATRLVVVLNLPHTKRYKAQIPCSVSTPVDGSLYIVPRQRGLQFEASRLH